MGSGPSGAYSDATQWHPKLANLLNDSPSWLSQGGSAATPTIGNATAPAVVSSQAAPSVASTAPMADVAASAPSGLLGAQATPNVPNFAPGYYASPDYTLQGLQARGLANVNPNPPTAAPVSPLSFGNGSAVNDYLRKLGLIQ